MKLCSRTPRSARAHDSKGEEGLTLVELVIAIGLGAFIFSAVAAALATGLRSLAAQKSRTQGNELATLGMEDLQRYSYPALGVCGLASPAPAGFTEAARPAGCGTSTDPAFGDNPCSPPTTPVGVPSGRYSCTRRNVTYEVRRYVAWRDAGRTAKQMAVVVEWTDIVGKHQVAQQTSVRSPDLSSTVGLDPPSFLASPAPAVSGVGSPNFVLGTGGLNPAMTFSAEVENILTSDRVFVTFNVLSGGEITATAFALTGSTTGTPGITRWSGTLASGVHEMPVGSQFILFTAVNQLDGKTGSEAVGSFTFCPSGGCPTDLPAISATPVVNGMSPTSIALTSSGALSSDVEVRATTTNVDPAAGDSVNFRFATREGPVTTVMTVQACNASGECSWKGAIHPASGYAFSNGDQKFDVIAERVARTTESPSTAAVQTGTVTFSGATT